MPLLIDGYNLLHVTGIFGRGRGPGGFHRSRQALLNFLAASLEPAELAASTIVFDAAGAPPGLPHIYCHEGLTVKYARDYADADSMLEELIAAHHAPKTLTVVSSDHRVQRAARRRRAIAVDSDRWYAEVLATRQARGRPAPPGKPDRPLPPPEVEYWLQEFQLEANESEAAAGDGQALPGRGAGDQEDGRSPFPPGYGDDLLQDLE